VSLHRWVHSEQNAIDYLAECGCPRDLLNPVEEWARQHVVSGIDLKRWCNRTGIYGGMWFQKQAAGGEE
jgi:hypothetical protein